MKKRILVVEDWPRTAYYAKELLSSEGYNCRTATNQEDALRIIDEWLPHLVVLDLKLLRTPGDKFPEEKCGWETAEFITRSNETRGTDIKVIIQSGFPNNQTKVEEGAYRYKYMAKPVDIEILVSEIAKLLQG